MSPSGEWGEEFQRLVLALAVEGGWPVDLPFRAAPFLVEGHFVSPRGRIARLLEGHWEKYRGAPGRVLCGEKLRDSLRGVSNPECRVVWEEWAALAEVSRPEDLRGVEDQVRGWFQRQALQQTLLRAAERLATPGVEVAEVHALLQREGLPGGGGVFRAMDSLVEGAASRVGVWRAGLDRGEPIPTGFPLLDQALDGGPRRGETFYFLAPPKGAKTTALVTTALGAVRRRFTALLVTYEMRARAVLGRADRALTRATRRELRDDPDRLERAVRGLRASGAGELYVLEALPQQVHAVAEVDAYLEFLRREGESVDLVLLDFLNIMGASRQEREKRHELARVSRDIAALARQWDVVVWSAALVNRPAVNKERIRKTDIAEAFEVIAVLDGAVAICGTEEMRRQRQRSLFVTALREEEDERSAGTYFVDLDRMTFVPLVEASPGSSDKEVKGG